MHIYSGYTLDNWGEKHPVLIEAKNIEDAHREAVRISNNKWRKPDINYFEKASLNKTHILGYLQKH